LPKKHKNSTALKGELKVASTNIQAIIPLIDKVFEQLHSRVSEIEHCTAGKDQIIKAVCDYVTLSLTAESKALFSTFYSRLADETLSKEPFLTTRNKGKFYDKDFRSMIYEKYSFSTEMNIDYKHANEKYTALPLPLGTAGLGVILSVVFAKAIIIPISLVIAGGLYYCISEYEKTKNEAEFTSSIQKYLNSIKGELIVWFENIEVFYNEQVEALKKSIDGESGER
jgi:hypothetical protein